MADMRRCSGSKTFGIEAHEAPPSDFPVQPSRKDGLGTMCKPHWSQYTGALRKASLERKAATAALPEVAKLVAPRPKIDVPAAIARDVAKERKAETKRVGRKPKAVTPESPRVRKAKAVIAATEALGGTAYTDAVGSDEVQAALEVAGSRDGTPEPIAT